MSLAGAGPVVPDELALRRAARARSGARSRWPGSAVLTGRAGILRAIRRRLYVGSAVTVAVVRLDRFEAIDEVFGTAAGDEALEEVIRRLRHASAAGDRLGRVGRNEFVVVLERAVRSEDAAATIGDHLADALDRPHRLGGDLVELSGTVTATTSVPGESAERFVSRARGGGAASLPGAWSLGSLPGQQRVLIHSATTSITSGRCPSR